MTENKKNSAFVNRHIVAAFALPVIIAYLYFLPAVPYFMILLGVIGMTALWEFYAMYNVSKKLSVPGVIFGGVLLYIASVHPGYFVQTLCLSLFLLMLLRLFLVNTPEGSMSEIGPLGTGLFYVSGFLSFQWLLRKGAFGLEYIFMLYIAIWLSDSMALYIGTYLGKNKLYPAYSPNKTVEGAFGSLLGGMLGTLITKIIFSMTALSFSGALVIGSVLGLMALLGDLIESMFKRDAGVKDSGTFIPGHGGILDKIDGMLVGGPALYFMVRYF